MSRELFQFMGINVDNCTIRTGELDITYDNQQLARGLAVTVETKPKTDEWKDGNGLITSIGIMNSHSGDFFLKLQGDDEYDTMRKARALATLLLLAADTLETRKR